MEKRLLLAAALSLGVLLCWEWLGPKPARRPLSPSAVPTAAATAVAAAPPSSAAAGTTSEKPAEPLPAPASAEAESSITVSNDLVHATFSNRGAVLTSFVLTGHFDEQKKPLELVRTLPPDLPRPMGLDFGADSATTAKIAHALFVVEQESRDVVRFRYADDRVAVVKEFRLGKGYLFDVDVRVTGPAFGVLIGPGLRNPTPSEGRSRYVMAASAVFATPDGMKVVVADKATGKDVWALPPARSPASRTTTSCRLSSPRAPRRAAPSPSRFPIPRASRHRRSRPRSPAPAPSRPRPTSAPRTSRSSRATASGSNAPSTSGGTEFSRGRCSG